MKKLFLIGILFSSLSTLRAQNKDFSLGVATGINIANITDNVPGASVTLDSRIGFKANLFFELPVSKNFSIQPELGYDGMGFKVKEDLTDPSSPTVTATINYLTLSILPKIKVNQTGLSFYAGPSLGFLLSSKASDNQGNSGNTDDSYSSLDVFAVVGTQYFFPMGLGFSARYMAGLTNIAKGTQDGESVHNHAWSFMIAYKFGSGK